MIITKSPGINGYSEKHIFIAGFVNTNKKPPIYGNSDFYLNVDYYPIGNKVLLFAHAIAGRNLNDFGSSQIIPYIMNQINSAEDINRKLEACPPRPYFVMKDDYLTKFIFYTGMRLKCCSIEIAPLRGYD